MKGDFGWDELAGRQGCERCGWLAEGGRVAWRREGVVVVGGGVEGRVFCCLMFHLLFAPRYLDYVPADLGVGG